MHVTNPNSPSPTFTLVSTRTGPSSSINDGTSCVGQPVDLGIAKTGPATVAPSGTITWTMTVHNGGPGNSSGFVVSDTLPASVTAPATATPGCSLAGHVLTCSGGALNVNQDAVITVTAAAPGVVGTVISNTASVLG